MNVWPLCIWIFIDRASSDFEIAKEGDKVATHLGDSVTLNCILKYRSRNEDFHISMEWEVPPFCEPSSYTVQPQFKSVGADAGIFELDLVQRDITIHEVRKQHEGHYICRIHMKVTEAINDAYASTYEDYFLNVNTSLDHRLNFSVDEPVTIDVYQTKWSGRYDPTEVFDLVWYIAGMPQCNLGEGKKLAPICNTFCPFDTINASDFRMSKFNDGKFMLEVKHSHSCDFLYEITAASSTWNKTLPLAMPVRSTNAFSTEKQLVTDPAVPKFNETFNVTCYIMSFDYHLGLVYESDKFDYICADRILYPSFINSFPTLVVRRLAILTVPLTLKSSGTLICGTSPVAKRRKYASRYFCFTQETNKTINGTLKFYEMERLKLSCRAPYCTDQGRSRLAWKSSSIDNGYSESAVKCAAYVERNLTKVNVTSNASGQYTCEQWQDSVIDSRHNSAKSQLTLRRDFNVTILPKPKQYEPKAMMGAIAVLGVLIVVLASVVLYFYIQSKQRKHTLRQLLNGTKGVSVPLSPDQPIHEQIDYFPFDQKWEFPRKQLAMGIQLGAGNFGVVYKAEAKGISEWEGRTTVAVKMAKRYGNEEVTISLIKELKIMSHLGSHCNVVNLLGAVTDKLDDHELMIIVEYCPYGNLHKYVINNRNRYQIDESVDGHATAEEVNPEYENLRTDEQQLMPFNDKVIIGWAYQISRGMEWLARRKVLHGDLAARNILLCNDNIVKICDFGLACNLSNYVYEREGGVKLPFRWLAVECLENRIFSTQSDVWAFGVTLWEIFSLGQMPYFEFRSLSEVWKRLTSGYRLAKPDHAPQLIYEMMMECWNIRPSERPSFSVLAEQLSGLLEDSIRARYLVNEDTSRLLNPIGDDDFFMMCKAPDFSEYQNVHALSNLPALISGSSESSV